MSGLGIKRYASLEVLHASTDGSKEWVRYADHEAAIAAAVKEAEKRGAEAELRAVITLAQGWSGADLRQMLHARLDRARGKG